jgi:hypothetical protein
MNNQIKELAEQAGYLPDMFGVGHWDMPECNKFAELIIKECITLCDDSDEEYSKSCDWAAEQIKKHFGIEE